MTLAESLRTSGDFLCRRQDRWRTPFARSWFSRLPVLKLLMLDDTDALHEYVVEIGRRLGFQSKREAVLSSAAGYAPRLDVLWTLSLSTAQLEAIRSVGALVTVRGNSLPIAAWEVEGSDASTKGMQADLANMRASGAPFGFLAVNGSTRDNLYKRAHQLTRTQRHYFGDQVAVPLDSNWLADLAKLPLSSAASANSVRNVKGGGGEGHAAGHIRNELRSVGERVGFSVSDSFTSPCPASLAPTRSQIDLAWTLPMPVGLRAFLMQVGEHDPDLLANNLVCPERYDHIVVVAFEIENDSKKHGYGGLLNLASHGMAGVFIAGNMGASVAAKAAHETYRSMLPLSRVSIHDGFLR